jgi:hypothetical protein
MNSYSYNYNPNHEVEEVKALGPDYFASLIYKVESRGVRVLDVTKSIVNQFQFGGTVSQKQASVLMNFNRKFGS